MTENKRITVFGGASPQPADPAYQQAYDLGALIGGAGYQILTGGYAGTMEAASRGAHDAGGHVIGVTCTALESWRPVPPNAWINEEMRYPTLRERMYALIDHCDVAIALPGGIGTLAEIAAMWSAMQTGEVERPVLIVVGEGWRQTFESLKDGQDGYIRAPHWDLLVFSPDIQDAFAQAVHHLKQQA